MELDKRKIWSAIIGFIACLVIIGCIAIGFFIGKSVGSRNGGIEIKRDTITRWDTIPHYYPKPVEVEKVRTEYQYLPLVKNVTETIVDKQVVTLHDSVLVEVPITSKHYHEENEYDAWVSGFNPSLDSIRTYNKTEQIMITKMKKPSRFSVGLQAGYGYNFNAKAWGWQVGLGGTYRFF